MKEPKIPVFITLGKGTTVQLKGHDFKGNLKGEEIGVKVDRQEDKAVLKMPFNKTVVSMSAQKLRAISLIVNSGHTHVLGNYDEDGFRCCVSMCGTTACGDSVCITCDGWTACC